MVELLLTLANRGPMIVLGAGPAGRETRPVEIVSLPTGEQFAFCANRWIWLNTSMHTRTVYRPDPTGIARPTSAVNDTRLALPGESDGTENLRTPVAPPPEPRAASNPVVDLTGTSPRLTIVAVATIRPSRSRTALRRTESGNENRDAAPARTEPADATAPTGALAVNINKRQIPAAPISTTRNRRDGHERTKPARLITNRNAVLTLFPSSNIHASCQPETLGESDRESRSGPQMPIKASPRPTTTPTHGDRVNSRAPEPLTRHFPLRIA
jgi:hypothetical protein